jgi:molybdopterin/thiamine biosynthesis adenylyltransferase
MERFFNQSKLVDQKKLEDLTFLVIGAGAIGSYTVMGLAKMGAKKIRVYDDDTLEEHNFDSQFYPRSMLGKSKVEALKDLVRDFGGCDISIITGRWDSSSSDVADVILVCVDNMDVRKTIWDTYKVSGFKLFVEGRMSAQVYRVYGLAHTGTETDTQVRDFYETTLYPQVEASPLPCGEKSIIFTVLQVSAQMCSQVKRWLMDEPRPTEVQYDCLNDEIVKTYIPELYPAVEVVE